ncbi:MAG: hypothetical protein WA962_02485 [Ornithinimicrobium sp.]
MLPPTWAGGEFAIVWHLQPCVGFLVVGATVLVVGTVIGLLVPPGGWR